ncbi:MAG: hypothetical protein U0572_09230 [Phycisphaerales bacterium]
MGRTTTACVGALLVTCCAFAQQQQPAKSAPPAHAAALTPAEAKEIDELIAKLVEIDAPDRGMSPSMSGHLFAPLPESATFDGGILGAHHLITPETIVKLVGYGPKAMPALLRSLDDPTPTKLKIEHGGGFGGMWHSTEVDVSVIRVQEQEAFAKHPELAEGASGMSEEDIHEWTITRGDVCFVVLGQIVNRSYQAMRYQPSACIVINSPVKMPGIAAFVREAWRTDDPSSALLQSLVADLKSEEWMRAAGAAMRLLYYFGDAAGPLLTAQLDSIADDEDSRAGACELVEAIRFTDRADVLEAIVRFAERSKSPSVIVAAAGERTVAHAPERMHALLFDLLAHPPEQQYGAFGTPYQALEAALRLYPNEGEQAARTLLGTNPGAMKWPVIVAIGNAPHAPWMVEFLKPYLDDESPTGWEYGPNHDRRPYQIRHFAAEAIAKHIAGAHLDLQRDRYDPDDVPAAIDRIRRAASGDLTALVEAEPAPTALIPTISPIASHTFEASLRLLAQRARGPRVLAITTDGGNPRYVTVDLASGAIEDLRAIKDADCGWPEWLQPPADDLLVAYDRRTSRFVIDSLAPDTEQRIVQTLMEPSSQGDEGDVPLNYGGFALTRDGSAMLALTTFGRLLRVSCVDGSVREVWKYDGTLDKDTAKFLHSQLIPLAGSDEFLVIGFPEHGRFADSEHLLEGVPRVWNDATSTMRTLSKVPPFGLRRGWGNIAWNFVNSDATLWDVTTDTLVKLPFDGLTVRDLVYDPAKKLMYALRDDGTISVVNIAARTVLRTLVPPPSVGEGWDSLMLSRDARSLYWISRPIPRGQGEARIATAIAVFDVGDMRVP